MYYKNNKSEKIGDKRFNESRDIGNENESLYSSINSRIGYIYKQTKEMEEFVEVMELMKSKIYEKI